MPDLSNLDELNIIAWQRGAYVEDNFGLEGLDGNVNIVDILNEFNTRIENIQVGGGKTRYVQQISAQATDTIIITENGGILPTEDKYITLFGPTTPLFQGAGAQKYTIDRVSNPNQIILGTTPLSPIDFYLEFWV